MYTGVYIYIYIRENDFLYVSYRYATFYILIDMLAPAMTFARFQGHLTALRTRWLGSARILYVPVLRIVRIASSECITSASNPSSRLLQF